MKFNADEIVSVLEREIAQYRHQVDSREVGKVLEVGDGIARVYGLSGVMATEMVEFTRTGARGVAFNLEENSVGIIILGDYLQITEGDEVRTTGQLLRVPVGDAVLIKLWHVELPHGGDGSSDRLVGASIEVGKDCRACELHEVQPMRRDRHLVDELVQHPRA